MRFFALPLIAAHWVFVLVTIQIEDNVAPKYERETVYNTRIIRNMYVANEPDANGFDMVQVINQHHHLQINHHKVK